MAIVYPLDVPLQEFSDVTVEAVDINDIQSSTFTGQDRVQEFEGDYWKITLGYKNLDEANGRQAVAFIQSLRKAIGTFVVRFPGYGSPTGAAKNTATSPLINGSGQAGSRTVRIKNATASVNDWLLAGDIIQIGPDNRPHWHTVLASVDTSATGTAEIEVWPAIRNTTLDNDPVVLEQPKGLCRMVTTPKIVINPPILYDIQITCREVTGQ